MRARSPPSSRSPGDVRSSCRMPVQSSAGAGASSTATTAIRKARNMAHANVGRPMLPSKFRSPSVLHSVNMSTNPTPDENLAALGLSLPQPPSPGGNYVPAKQAGGVLYLSGVVASGPDGIITGLAGVDRTIEE